MDRRLLTVAAFAAVLVVLAAASGPVRVWTTPDSNATLSPVEDVGPRDTVVPVDQDSGGDRRGEHRWSGILSQIVGVVIVLIVAVSVASIGRWVKPGRRRLGERHGRQVAPLPEVPEQELNVDIGAAHALLSGGEPRNAIVACWMQLERDAAAAGLARMDAETSAEYVERVVAASSLDPAPIGQLAALYREARFSLHELGDDHRARALVALERVAAALQRVEVVQ